MEVCKAKCLEETDFLCKSIEYKNATETCQMTSLGSASQHHRIPCHDKGWLFTERLDARESPGIPLHNQKEQINKIIEESQKNQLKNMHEPEIESTISEPIKVPASIMPPTAVPGTSSDTNPL